MRIPAMLACVAMTVLMAPMAHADTTARVVGTWPSGDSVTLGRHQTFYVHIRYHSDVPTRIWARPWANGQEVDAGSNPSRVYPAGNGDALGWFFLSQPDAYVTDIQITAGNGSPQGTRVVADYPVEVYGSDAPASSGTPPEWVSRLRAEDKAAQDAADRKAMSEPTTAGDAVLFAGFMLLVAGVGIFGLFAPVWGLWRWRGGWRIAAAIPAAVMAFVVLRLIVGVSLDPTSHNLWPFEIFMAGVLSTVVMIVLLIAHRLVATQRSR